MYLCKKKIERLNELNKGGLDPGSCKTIAQSNRHHRGNLQGRLTSKYPSPHEHALLDLYATYLSFGAAMMCQNYNMVEKENEIAQACFMA